MIKQVHFYTFIIICSIVWTLLISYFGHTAIETERRKTLELAKKEAETTLNKDQSYRLWAVSHGGVYVQVSERTQPNMFLNHIEDRDVSTMTGKQLTLMNPAFMIRQVMKDYDKRYKTQGYITSLTPLNPANAPDEWQQKALRFLADGKREEVFELVQVRGHTVLKMMHPVYTRKGCLGCHKTQGHELGDLRGGVGVEIPMTPYLDMERQSVVNIRNSHLTLWFFGMIVFTTFSVWGTIRIHRENQAAGAIRLANRDLKKALEEVKTLRGIIPICSFCMKIRNDKGAWGRLEAYISEHSDARVSHGLCPECYEREVKRIKSNRCMHANLRNNRRGKAAKE